MAERRRDGDTSVTKVRVLAGVFLLVTAVAVGGVAVVWTVFRAMGGEVDWCPGGGGSCITAYWITVPGLLGAVVVGLVGVSLLRRR